MQLLKDSSMEVNKDFPKRDEKEGVLHRDSQQVSIEEGPLAKDKAKVNVKESTRLTCGRVDGEPHVLIVAIGHTEQVPSDRATSQSTNESIPTLLIEFRKDCIKIGTITVYQ